MARSWNGFDWLMLLGSILLLILLLFCMGRGGSVAAGVATGSASSAGSLMIADPSNGTELQAGSFTLSGSGTPGETLEIFEDDVSLGTVVVGTDGKWSKLIPSPQAGDHTYQSKASGGTSVETKVKVAAFSGTAANCTKDFVLSISDGQTVQQPFRFGGDGSGKGYTVTVKRGDRTIGTKLLPLDGACGWGYNSRPGAGSVSYEIREIGATADSTPKQVLNITVQ